MITAFGRALRKLRIDHGEVLKDMSTHLQVSTAFLSAVETGKKAIPDKWITQIASIYSLNAAEIEQLESAARDSATSVKIDLHKSDIPQRRAALVFARDFNNLSAETATQIINLLNSENRGG